MGADNVIIDQISLHEKEKGKKGEKDGIRGGGMSDMARSFIKVEELFLNANVW